MTALPSIFNSPPLEKGGVDNRRGINFQDHVAARFCLKMLDEGIIEEVWHEYHDDVTLVRKDGLATTVEYIQVKNTDEQYWSLSALTIRDTKKASGKSKSTKVIGSSILEKNLANDIRSEKAYFRIVTSKNVGDDLRILTNDLSTPIRDHFSKEILELIRKINERVGDYRTDRKGTDPEYWVRHVIWDVFTNTDLLASDNKVILRRYAEKSGIILKNPECDTVYRYICDRMFDAGVERADVSPESKKFRLSEFKAEIDQVISDSIIPTTLYEGMTEFDVSLDFLSEVIVGMHEAIDSDGSVTLNVDFALIDMSQKNKINGMSKEFFDYLVSAYVKHFDAVRNFLSKPVNNLISDKYQDLAHEINVLLCQYKGSVANFDEFLMQLCRNLTNGPLAITNVKKRYVWLLLSYMYFNCDIGNKS